MTKWIPQRTVARRALADFLPRADHYGRERNFDYGPDDRSNVSTLSPWLRHRLLCEDEVVAEVLARHRYRTVEKFLQEVLWRTYWKGWLELRPQFWDDWKQQRDAARARLALHEDLARRHETAINGTTGIQAFDTWARELPATGYLHNHARMWFASIWIFTLRLPWALGADFFYRHLLDGDPASNTLSWRWVAGLHTPGKHYVATPNNIRTYTNERLDAGEALTNNPEPLPMDDVDRSQRPLPAADKLPAAGRWGLLLHGDDLSPETAPWAKLKIASVAAGPDRAMAAHYALAPAVRTFTAGALDDARRRAGRHYGVSTQSLQGDSWTEAVLAWAREQELEGVVTPWTPVGPWAEAWRTVQPQLTEAGIATCQPRRPWDEQLWPHATKGYFAFKKKMGAVLRNLGLSVPG